MNSSYLAAESSEPARPTAEDGGCHRDGFNVGDRSRAAEHANVGREGRLQARLSLAALIKILKKNVNGILIRLKISRYFGGIEISRKFGDMVKLIKIVNGID